MGLRRDGLAVLQGGFFELRRGHHAIHQPHFLRLGGVELPRLAAGVAGAPKTGDKAAWKPRPPKFTRGYGRLFLDHVLQADDGCDFDFLRGKTPVRLEDTAGPSHS